MLKVVLNVLGVIVVLLVAFLIVTFTAHQLFDRNVKKEVGELFRAQGTHQEQIVTQADLDKLPPAVEKWLTNARVVGQEKAHTVRLKQKGVMRTQEGQPWMPFTAEQYYTTGEPGFIWHANVKAAPLVNLAGRDMYYKGQGNMLIKLFSLVTVANGSGKEMDQGALLRYLGEMVWFPSAALNDYITWQTIDDSSVQATITVNGITASGVFSFDADGNPSKFTARRYMSTKDGSYSLETWVVSVKDYRELNGIIVPASAEVTWDLPSGKFTWFKGEVTAIEYNKPELY